MLSSTHNLSTSAHDTHRRAEQELAHAERVAELADLNVHRRGGLGLAPQGTVDRWIGAHERVWICEQALGRNGGLL